MVGDDASDELVEESQTYFYEILKGEFSDKRADLIPHKYLIENFKVQLHLQLNKNIKQPSMPATLKFPQIKAKIIIGEQEDEQEAQSKIMIDDDGQMHGDANALLFSLYQPQILRIMKTLETIGFFNEFKEGALALFHQKKISVKESEEYIEHYVNWRDAELEEEQIGEKGTA